MYRKILKKLPWFSNCDVCGKDRLSINVTKLNVNHMATFWGHDTLEEQEARERKEEESRVRKIN